MENLELPMVDLLKHGVGQTVATHASPAARNASLSISTFPVRSVSFVSFVNFFLRLSVATDPVRADGIT